MGFSGSIPPKFEHKLCCHQQRFGNIITTAVLDKDENLLRSGLQWHRSCHSNEMMSLLISLAAIFLGTGDSSMFGKFRQNLGECYRDILG